MLTEEQRNEIQQVVDAKFSAMMSAADKIQSARDIILKQLFPEGILKLLAEKLAAGEKLVLSDVGVKRDIPTSAASADDAQAPFLALQAIGQRAAAPPPLTPLVRVIARAVEVLGTSEKALRWIHTPVRSLGDQTPVSLLSSPEGIERVEDALGSIEHGVW